MDSGDNPGAVMCHLCGEAFSLPEDDLEGNLPRLLLCAHIYCTSCLLSIHCDGVIRCPECEVESTLPQGGVFGLQEDSRIIGLIYTSKINKLKRCDRAKNRKKYQLSSSTDMHVDTEDVEQPADMEKMKKLVDEALSRAAENLSVLQNIRETLTIGQAEQVKRERARLEIEIERAADKALHAVQKWKDVQLSQLTHLEARFSSIQAEVSRVQKREKDLEIAMQMAREVRRVPFLEQYCTLDKVLETLQAPVDRESYDMKCIAADGMSCVFQSECLNQSLALSLKMEVGPKQQSAKGRNRNCLSPKPEQEQESPAASSPSSRGSSPRSRSSTSTSTSTSDPGSPDVIVEELLIEEQEKDPVAAVPPTGPELANDNGRIHRRRSQLFDNRANRVTQWVVLSHVVNPSNFYVHCVAEKRESEILSKKINHYCCRDSCRFTASDAVETGSLIFVKCEERLWCRANVVEVFQIGCKEAVKTCKAPQLARVRLFLLDSGLGKSLIIQSEEDTPESVLKGMNDRLRRVGTGVKAELSCFGPQAIRCSLKDLVPYDPAKGWSKAAQQEFVRVVGSAAVEMRPLGWDRESLLVDLRKAPMERAGDAPISVREYLVFIEVARFYSPVKPGRRPLLYYSPQQPQINTELNAVVSHVHSPADFYIQFDDMEFALLSAKIQDCYNAARMTEEDDLSIYCPVIEEACVARYQDTLWYRAQVTGVGHPGDRKVEVQYVDFGNKKLVSVSDLRKIKEEFFAVPSRAIRCCLSDVVPLDGDTWSDACSNRFISLAHRKLVTIVATGKVPPTDPLPVKLFESSLNGPLDNIAELLVNEQLASFREGLESPAAGDPAVWDPPLELGSAAEAVDGERSDEPADFLPQLKLLDRLKDLKVRVSHVNSPSSFFVQFAQFSSQLKRMCELVEKECELVERQEELVWKADQFCAARINGVWERGRLASDVTARDSAEVMRCDHGNKVKVHFSDLRPLPSSLMGSLALECTLTGIRPAGGRSTWSATACDLFSFHLTGASAVLAIKELTDERPVAVSLFRSNETGQLVSMADFLATEGLGLRERKPRDIQRSKETDAPMTDGSDGDKKLFPTVPSVRPRLSPKPAPRTIMTPEKVRTRLYHPPELLRLGPVKITVSAVGEDGVIYTRTQTADCRLEQLKERIQQSMKTLPRQKPYTWKSVQGCAVIGPDMLWYRGQLLEVLGGHVKVQYVDYGLVENIPVVHVYPVLLCEDIPQLCMSCQLHSINPVGGRWQRDAVALMRELLLNRRLDMNVTALPADPREPLTVELFLDGLSLNRILTHHEHASMDRTVSPQKEPSEMTPAFLDEWDIDIENLKGPEEPMLGRFILPNLPQKGEQFQVKVMHLQTPNELFLWPLEGAADVEVDGETLGEALTRINGNIGATQRLTDFRRGGPCLAQYSDRKFYRAQMSAFSSVEPVRILVQHVDFGSEDPLPTSRLRRMPAELLRFPLQALKVKVAGFKAPSASGQEDVLSYSPGWSRKAVMDMLEMLHGDITASVVALEPELTVLLYNKDGELLHLPLVSSGLAELE